MSLSRTVVVGLLAIIAVAIVLFILMLAGFIQFATYGLLFITVIFAILAIEDKDLLHAALYLAGSAIALALIYLVLFAPWVAFFQLAIYAGAVTIILVSAVALTARRGTGEVEEDAS
ncbi:MAG: NADH-quinone oxidoreductase subunit J [Candidatus Hodarchaeota archaeon]